MTKHWCGGDTKSLVISMAVTSFRNDACLQRSYQTLDILFIYKGKAITVKESKWFRYLIHGEMDSDRHKGVDCGIPIGWKWVISFTILIMSKSVRDYKGIKGYNVLWPLSLMALSACLFNQNSFKFKGLIETVKLYHYDVFVGVIFRLTRLCW